MFNKLKAQVQQRLKELSASDKPLFYVEIDRDLIWEHYLAGFADPIERQGNTCNCCKSFLRQYAGIVGIVDNKVQSLWDLEVDAPYTDSVKNVRNYIMSLPITDMFVNGFAKCGTDRNVDGKDRNVVWDHFFVELPKKFVMKEEHIPTFQAALRDNKSVLKRSLEEISIDAVNTVLELIGQNSLYRGKESEGVLIEFQKIQQAYAWVPAKLKDNYVWSITAKVHQSLTRIKNTSIGTLLVDLTNGVDLDEAVTKFERMVAPTNYKRPTALVTPRMVEDAKKKLEELGYLESLNRRFAVATDLNINNLLFIDKSSSVSDVFEDMKKDTTVNPRTLSKTEEIGIDAFISDVLPKAKGLYVLLENSHLKNMMTLLTEQNQAPSLFKWNNPFSWAYTGGITDSIKERVKEAGGKVDGEVRVSLSWHNYDDLDLHVKEPSGNRICFSSKSNPQTLGRLDVDMNAGGPSTRNAVENITWPDAHRMDRGRYQVMVHNYSQREMKDAGFTVQIECRGEVFDLEFPRSPRNGEYNSICEFNYSKEKGLEMIGDVKSNVSSKQKWNLNTNRFHKVKQVMLSPNCWSGVDKGNKHHFFILENCASDEATRPFFNEFLKEEIAIHRKFFETLGGKLLVSPTTTQLAGVGFSETQRNHVYVRVEGAFKRTLKINF